MSDSHTRQGAPNLVDIRGISKKFGNRQALNNVNLSIQRAEIVGLIGPNGSGKTTLLNVMMSMIKPDSGEVSISSEIGMAVSRKGFFSDMTVVDNARIFAMMTGASFSQVSSIFDQLQIDFATIRFSKLSAGMKQKVSIAFALLQNCDLLLLDEPINHLDFDAILSLRKILSEKKLQGVSSLIASHVLTDLEKLCDRVIFLKNGSVIGDEPISDLLSEYGSLEIAYQRLF